MAGDAWRRHRTHANLLALLEIAKPVHRTLVVGPLPAVNAEHDARRVPLSLRMQDMSAGLGISDIATYQRWLRIAVGAGQCATTMVRTRASAALCVWPGSSPPLAHGGLATAEHRSGALRVCGYNALTSGGLAGSATRATGMAYEQ